MKSKKGIIIPLVITIILLIGLGVGYWYIYGNDYVFKINGEKITMLEFNTYLKAQKAIMEAQFGENVWDILIEEAPAIEVARDSAKQGLVDTKLKLQQARKMKLSLTSEEKELIRGAVEMYGQTLQELYGITFEELLKINEENELIRKLEVELYKQEDHSTHEHGPINIEKYERGEETGITFDSRHILFDTKELSEEDANARKVKAEGVLARVKNGEDFGTLAKEFSEDPGSKDNGGLYEGIGLGQFVSEYENAVLSLNDGEIYPELVKSAHGYHIIKLEKLNDSEYLSLAETEAVLQSELDEKAKIWLEEAQIEVNEQQYNSAQ